MEQQLNTFQSKLSKGPSKSKKEKFLHLILFLMLFSNSTLRNEEYMILYTGLSLLISIYTVFRGIINPSKISRTMMTGFTIWTIIIYSMYFFYGVALTKYDYFSVKYFIFMFIMIIITVLLFIDIPVKNMVETFIKACSTASVAICLFIMMKEWSLIMAGVTRIGESGSGNVNTLAIFLGTMSIPCIYKVLFEKRYVYLIPYGLSTIIMLLTGSKKALLFIILGVIILSILKNGIKLHKYILPLLIIIGLLFLIFNNEYLYNIIGFRVVDFIGALGIDVGNASYSHSTSMRIMMNKLAFEAFKSKPIFGGGWFYFSAFSGLGTYSHNNYMELLVTYGLVGFSFYYSMFLTVLIRLKRIIKIDNYAKLLFTMLITILINDFAVVSFSYNVLNYQVLIFSYLYVKGLKATNNINKVE